MSFTWHKQSVQQQIAQLPQHWEANLLKRGHEITLGKMLQNEPKQLTDVRVPYLRSANVQWGTVDTSDVQEMWFAEGEAEQLALSSGDLVVCEGGDAGRAAIWRGELGLCGFQNSVNRVRADDGNSSDFLMYWLAMLKAGGYVDMVCNKATIAHLTKEKLGNLPMVFPPAAEQLAIAKYLDAETERIDALISAKHELLALLGEQRRMVAESVIAPVPGGREAKLGYFVDLLPGYAFPSEGFSNSDRDVPLLRGVNVAPGATRWEDVVYWPVDQAAGLERFRLQVGDVVFGMDRPWISSGTRTAIIDSSSAGALLLQRVCRIRGDETMSNRFVYYVLCSDKFRQSIEYELSGISVPHISPEQITRFRVPLLSMEEQRARCAVADTELSKLDRLIALTREMVSALQELRSASITEAVLGRMDVGDYTKN